MSSLGYGAEPDVFNTDVQPALTGENQPLDPAILFALAPAPLFMDVFEHLPSDQKDEAHSYFCGAQGCYECFSTTQDRTGHEIDVHGQDYSQAPRFRVFEQDGNGDMMMPQGGLGSVNLQQPVVVPAPVLVQRSIDIQPGQKLCHVCDKDCRSHSKLIAHMRTHTGKKPYACSYEGCGNVFTRKTSLRQHMMIHTGEKPYPCSYKDCGKAFIQSHNLKDHIRIHTGARPYACSHELCGKAFSQKSSLKRHMKVHKKADNATFGSLSSE